jgi:hypothetical protein
MIMLRAENDQAQEEPSPVAADDTLEAIGHADGLGFVIGAKSGALYADHDAGRWAPLGSSLEVTVHAISSAGPGLLVAAQFGSLHTSLIEYAPQLPSLFCPQRLMVQSFNPTHVARLGDQWLVGGLVTGTSTSALDSVLMVVSNGG